MKHVRQSFCLVASAARLCDGSSGIDVLRAFHAQQGITLMAMTTSHSPREQTDANALGAIYLVKPFASTALRTVVRAALLSSTQYPKRRRA